MSTGPAEQQRPVGQQPQLDFRALFEATPGAFLVLDPDLKIVSATDAYLAATMTVREEIVGRDIFDVFPDDPEDPAATGVRNLRASLDRVCHHLVADTMAVQRYDIQRPDARGGGFEERYWSPRNVPIVDRVGHLNLIVHRVEDVTDFVRASQRAAAKAAETAELHEQKVRMESEIVARSHELRILNDQLTTANRAKTEFLSRMSHELRTPLSAMLGFTELVGLSTSDVEVQRYVATVMKAGQHLLKLVNEILDISQIDSGRIALSVEPVSLRSLIRESVELMEPLAKDRGVELIERTRGRSLYVTADRQRLKQVVINLLSNGIKYNRPGGQVTIAAQLSVADADCALVVVDDTGYGIAADALPQLFTPFERLNAPQRGIDGTGLGLALSRTLVEAMGGTINVSTQAGHGTAFSIELQVAEPTVLDEDAVADTIAVARTYDVERCLLYIEDIVANVDLVEEVARFRPGTRVISAMLGGTGIDLARRYRPDLILLDLHLPDMDGEAVLDRLGQDPITAGIPVIIITADATKRQLNALLRKGAARYLTKPIAVRHLLATFDEYLSDDSTLRRGPLSALTGCQAAGTAGAPTATPSAPTRQVLRTDDRLISDNSPSAPSWGGPRSTESVMPSFDEWATVG